MTPFEQAKVEKEYLRLLRIDSKRKQGKSSNTKVRELLGCLNSSVMRQFKRPSATNPCLEPNSGSYMMNSDLHHTSD